MEGINMSNKPVKGLKIGNYRITPLGLAVLAALLLILIAAVLWYPWCRRCDPHHHQGRQT